MRRSRLLLLLILFAALSAADFGLTWFLINNGGGAVYEGNPVAGWWLEQFGWMGLAGFKFGQVALVAGLGLLIARWRPRAGRWVLSIGCSVLACVVIYSVSLARGFGTEPGDPTVSDLVDMADHNEELTQGIRWGNEYRVVLHRVSTEIIEGKIGLKEATDRLAACERSRSPQWQVLLHRAFPELSDRECLAANLATHCLSLQRSDPDDFEAMTAHLKEEFRAGFGRELPDLPVVLVKSDAESTE